VTNNGPLRAGKGNVYEGGIRVPLIMSWPGHILTGSTCTEPVVCCDFFPTFTAVVGAQLPSNQRMDGLSLVPLFMNPLATLNRDMLYWYYPYNNQSAIRQRDWKLVEKLDTGIIELYNLSQDLSEQVDMKETNPSKAMELLADLRAWRTGIPRFSDTDGNGFVDMQDLLRLCANWQR